MTAGEPTLRVRVNEDTCEGTGYCEQVAPALFKVSVEGVSEALVTDVPAEHRDAALTAEKMCPTRSVRVAIEGW